MPFTVAHAAVAPPLARLSRGRLPTAALAVGAMSPDFEYLLFLETHRTISHSAPGLLVLCLPASLAALALWHHVVKVPLARLLPPRWAHLGPALGPPRAFASWPGLAWTCAAALAGAASHLVLDAFTHRSGWGVALVPALGEWVPRTAVPAHWALQFGLSVAGLALLAVAAVAWARRQPHVPAAPLPRRWRVGTAAALAAVTVAAAAANAARLAATAGHALPPRALLTAALVGAMGGAAAGILGYGAMATARNRRPGWDSYSP